MRTYKKEYRLTDAYRQQVANYQQSPARRAVQARYREGHRNLAAIAAQRRRARVAALPVEFSLPDWERCLEYFGHRCAVCGEKKKLAQDHWIPVSRGGPYTVGNIVPLCHGRSGCNHSKNDADPTTWLRRKFGNEMAMIIEQRIRTYFSHSEQSNAI